MNSLDTKQYAKFGKGIMVLVFALSQMIMLYVCMYWMVLHITDGLVAWKQMMLIPLGVCFIGLITLGLSSVYFKGILKIYRYYS